MRYGKKVVCLFVMGLLLSSGASLAQNQGDQQNPMAMSARQTLDYFTGKWQTSYQYLNFGMVTEHSTYTRGADQNTLNVHVQVMRGQIQLDGGSGTMSYDPEQDIITSSINTQSSMQPVRTREVRREGNVVWFEGSGGQMMPRFRIKMEFINRSTFNWTMFVPAGTDWRVLNSVVYQRMPEQNFQ